MSAIETAQPSPAIPSGSCSRGCCGRGAMPMTLIAAACWSIGALLHAFWVPTLIKTATDFGIVLPKLVMWTFELNRSAQQGLGLLAFGVLAPLATLLVGALLGSVWAKGTRVLMALWAAAGLAIIGGVAFAAVTLSSAAEQLPH